MRTANVLSSLVGSFIVCLMLAGVSKAEAPQAFVSSHGDDMNPCTADKPCQTFNQALTAVQAGGAIIVQDSGVYSNGFTITKSVTIDAAGFNASVVSTTSLDLCTINAGPDDRVVLRGISFQGPTFTPSLNNGVGVIRVGFLYLERCAISGFKSAGVTLNRGYISLKGTDIRKCGVGIAVFADELATTLVAHDTHIDDCDLGFYLNSFGGFVSGLLSDCAPTRCGTGFFATGSENVDLTLTNCRAFNSVKGIYAQARGTGSVTVRIANCVVIGNSVGILVERLFGSTGKAKVLGTNPGTNLVHGNLVDDGSTNAGVALQ